MPGRNDIVSDYDDIMARSIIVWADNEEKLTARILDDVNERIRYGSGYRDLDPELYAELHRNRQLEIISNLRDAVGDAFIDVVGGEYEGTLIYQVLVDLLDLGNVGIWEQVAEHFIPEPDDYEEWYA